MLDAGQSGTVTFNEPGTYNYICTPHPFMVGQIIVTGQKLAGKPSVIVDAPNSEKAGVQQAGTPTMSHASH
jgi:heme/copper-type cytochrome/quinol oxidase subunit 2